jgi:hypothetical protein
MKNITLMFIMLGMVLGCDPGKSEESKMPLKNQESTIQHCVGRSLIQLPISFLASKVTTGIFKYRSLTGQEPIDVLVRAGETTPNFAFQIQKRKAELEDSGGPNVDVLREMKTLGNDAALFRVQRIDDAYVSEIFVLRGSNIITARLHSFRKEYVAAEETLIKFASGISMPDSDRNPTPNEGFCLGPVEVRGDFGVEKANFLFRNGRGAQFEVNVDTYAPDDRVSLLARMSGPNSLLKIFDVRPAVYRARETTAAGTRAQEWLGAAQTTEDEHAKAFQFTLETMRPSPGKATPGLNLTFETAQPLEDGSQTKTLISEDEAIRMWDSVVPSLRSAMP